MRPRMTRYWCALKAMRVARNSLVALMLVLVRKRGLARSRLALNQLLRLFVVGLLVLASLLPHLPRPEARDQESS